ncbi:Amidohydrolase [Quillaja saponaria]|uniref:Amidohydrolase n=1 Tax=Quillaja saponaria TaxID=32244 RepID=A0AAD7PBB8_QUISA|nr:Amidohydrolase [Quillaja saponaria]
MNFYILLSASVVLVLAIVSLPLLNLNYFLNWQSPSSYPVADLIVRNGVLYTSDESLPFADSMAVRKGRILRVGNYSFVQELAGDVTEELDVGGKIVVPGFIDSHVHLIYGGLQMMQVGLRGVNNKDEFVRIIKEAARSAKQGSWILGGGWNNDAWGGDLPVASWIDDITPFNPVWLSRMDGHMGLANSLALKLAGITNSSEDPKGGTIMRTTNGEPTGLLIDSAMELVVSQIPENTLSTWGGYFPAVPADLSWADFSEVYQWAHSLEIMKIRVCLFFPMETWSLLSDLINKMGHSMNQWIYFGGVKAFADGSLGSNSALFYEPYVDEPDNYGLQVTELEVLLNMTLASDLSGLQVAIHAIGDRANDLMLDMYQTVASTNGMRDRRFRIEHAQHLASGTAVRFGNQGVVASVQPDHLLDDADSAIRKLGMDRAVKESYLFGSLLAGNALLAFGSDWPVADINPLRAIKTAVKRIPHAWDHTWIPSECITVDDALKSFTISAARACFLDNDLGSLSPGKLADFVILSVNSWENFATEASASVEATYVSGVQAYP